MSCAFCKIATDSSEAYVVEEGDTWIAFLSIGPVVDGHILVASKQHVESAVHDPALAGELTCIATHLGAHLFGDGFVVRCNVGKRAHMTVDHLHVHLLPCAEEDSLSRWEKLGERARPLPDVLQELLASRHV